MFGPILKKVFGSKNEREVKRMEPLVESINAMESEMEALSDDELSGLTPKFQERISGGESLDAILPEAFAAVREVSKRRLAMRHFDVQLVGGIVLHEGKIAEMKTG
ncbi:MAG: preprotein translocase subunit SecA, partial [Deltaproteobacteria bacterium]|nr:preprotein translocase subunit SecA [Deltaproteobacteria bacterium]